MAKPNTSIDFSIRQSDSAGKIKYGEKIAYSLTGAGEQISFAVISTFMVYFYTDYFGINAGIIGTILFFSQILNAVGIILLGVLFDKTGTKKNAAKNWIVWLALPHAIALVATFYVPALSMAGKIIYAFITYNLLTIVCYSAINLAYGVLNARMTTNALERSDLSIFRTISSSVVTIIVNLFTLKIVERFGDNSNGWVYTMLIYGALAILLFAGTYFFTKERIVILPGADALATLKSRDKNNAKGSIRKSIAEIFKNKYCIILMLVFMINHLIQGTQNVYIYYCTYFLKNAEILGVRSMAGVIAMIIMLVFLHPLIKKYGKRNLALIGTILSLVGYMLILINTGSIPLSIVSYAVIMLGLAPFMGIRFAMVSDTVEYGEWKSGSRNEGMTFSVVTFGQKIGTGVGAALTGWTLALANYVPKASIQSISTMNGILLLMVWVPAILSVIQIILLYKYKLDKEYPSILNDLKSRNKLLG